MTVLFVVLPLAVLLSGLAALAFVWATRRGQFDDLETPALRLLTDELEERRATAPEVSPPPRV
ncbi:MAG TPA: cbb3-type cytochrome oxidase assembly protein CcoS [Polyangiaceae bacterium]|nr:cbb3-type cytochrome oxidase assembly protein CcoS [Polyangiaceae bacterium]